LNLSHSVFIYIIFISTWLHKKVENFKKLWTNAIMRCDKIYGECVNKKLIILKDTLPLIPLKILPVALNTLDLLFLPLSEAVQYVLFCVSFVALSWLPRCPESISKCFSFQGHFDCGGRARSSLVLDPFNEVVENTP
jgi:hypothetical protein